MTRAVFGGASTSSGSKPANDFDFDDFDAGPSAGSSSGASSSGGQVAASELPSRLTRVQSTAPSKNLDETSTEVTSLKCPKVSVRM